MPPITAVPEPADATFPHADPPVRRGGVHGTDIEVLAERLQAYVAEPRPPMTIGDLAEALGAGPLDCGRAILELHDRGVLAVTPLPGDRFALRPTAG
jgi:hypothetical protein